MQIRCPHCQNPIEVVQDEVSFDCPSCGKSVQLADAQTIVQPVESAPTSDTATLALDGGISPPAVGETGAERIHYFGDYELLEEIAALHDLVNASFDGTDSRKPSFVIRRGSDAEKWVRFAGLPMGHEFTSLVLALLWAGGHPPKVDADVLEDIRRIETDLEFEMFFSLSCHNCPDVVQALTLMALENSRITATLIEGGAYKDEVEARDIMAVPATFLNGESFYNGKIELPQILERLDTGAGAKAAAKLNEREPYEVLVIGSGPAGVATSVYTARKGFRTGIAGERFGGQLQDTLGIENLPGTSLRDMLRPKPSSQPAAASLSTAVGSVVMRTVGEALDQTQRSLSGANVLWLGDNRF